MTPVASDSPSVEPVATLLAWAREELTAAQVSSPDVDARWLLAHVAGIDESSLIVRDAVAASVADEFRRLVAARAARHPLQYLTGSAPFYGLDLAVGPGVFIPRLETELLAQWAIGAAPAGEILVVDFCSGSGALAIALATHLPAARVVAVEESWSALMWLRRNAAAQPPAVADRITVLHADVTAPAELERELAPASVDLLVANPPYVPADTEVPPEVDVDPADAVFAGTDGMSVIDPMVPVIAALLRPGGLTAVEHDDGTGALVRARLTATGDFADITAHDDLAGRPRFVTARRVQG